MSCRSRQINSICRLGGITTPSCGVRFVLIQMPLHCHMYQFILCGCARFCEAEEEKVTDSDMRFVFVTCVAHLSAGLNIQTAVY